MTVHLMTTPELLHRLILLAVQDGADRYDFLAIDGSSCEVFAWVGGEKWELVPVPFDWLQALSAELARSEGPDCLTRWFQRARSGLHAGSFRYPIGTEAILVEYRVCWQEAVVSEVVICVEPAAELAEAARATLHDLALPQAGIE